MPSIATAGRRQGDFFSQIVRAACHEAELTSGVLKSQSLIPEAVSCQHTTLLPGIHLSIEMTRHE